MAVNATNHPYFPRSLVLPNYVPNDMSMIGLLSMFFSFIAVLMGITWMYTAGKFTKLERCILCWFVSCGIIHTFLEGHFSLFHATMLERQDFLAQMWKEYGKADSRYLISDNFTVVMESITAWIEGPLSFITVLAFLRNSPYRYVFQIILSLGQLYGATLYFLLEAREGFPHGPYRHPLYFWFYFVFLNTLWIVIPLLLIYQAACKLGKAQELADGTSIQKKSK